jgi:hypothetical protein
MSREIPDDLFETLAYIYEEYRQFTKDCVCPGCQADTSEGGKHRRNCDTPKLDTLFDVDGSKYDE